MTVKNTLSLAQLIGPCTAWYMLIICALPCKRNNTLCNINKFRCNRMKVWLYIWTLSTWNSAYELPQYYLHLGLMWASQSLVQSIIQLCEWSYEISTSTFYQCLYITLMMTTEINLVIPGNVAVPGKGFLSIHFHLSDWRMMIEASGSQILEWFPFRLRALLCAFKQ